MKKIFKVLFSISLCLTCFAAFLLFGAFSCEKKKTLNDFVSELRTDVFEGSSDNYSLKAAYGFKETPYINDGVIGEKVYSLSFVLTNKLADDVKRTIVFSFNQESFVFLRRVGSVRVFRVPYIVLQRVFSGADENVAHRFFASGGAGRKTYMRTDVFLLVYA